MTFKKLALASAIAIAPMATFAVDVLDDAALSAATGQDGIEIALDLSITTNVIIHDKGGIDNPAYQSSYTADGAIVIQGLSINATNNTVGVADGILVQIDAGDSSAAGNTSFVAPVLNVHVVLQGNVTIVTGAVGVANSRRDDGAWGTDGATKTIMNSAQIILGGAVANIQLGNEPQGSMVLLNTSVNGGVVINNFALLDATPVTGGAIGADTMTIIDANGGANLTVVAGINVTNTTGLEITVNQAGAAGVSGGMDIRIENQYLGSAALGYIGDIEMQNVNLNGTIIAISGK